MARSRLIKPEFFADEDLPRCSAHARLAFVGLWTLADRRGRLREVVPVIHGKLFPFEPGLNVPALLDELEAARAVLAKLPKTADGVTVVPGMVLTHKVFSTAAAEIAAKEGQP